MFKCKNDNCDRIDIRSSGLCKKHHHQEWILKKEGRKVRERISFDLCQAPDCNQPTSKNRGKYCEKHYVRLRRNGRLDLVGITEGKISQHTAGYILEYRKNHEKFGSGSHYQHRIVFYDNNGNGPFECFNCGKQVDWHDMHVHHINEKKNDNRIENLTASCPKCNSKASKSTMIECLHNSTDWNLTIGTETKHVSLWAKEYNKHFNVIKWRIINGWDIEKAITLPVRRKKTAKEKLNLGIKKGGD